MKKKTEWKLIIEQLNMIIWLIGYYIDSLKDVTKDLNAMLKII